MNENEIENELKHWGILGMHWGIRRFQNPDGSLTPEGRERYLKKVDDAIKNENKSYKVTSKAIDEFNKKLPELNAYLEKQGWIGDDWQAHEKESNEYLAKEWKKIFKELANKEYGEIANKVYDNEEEWMSQFLYYHLYTDEFTNRQLYASDDFDENILKHWGILGMKWGIRNYQNPDGSLTPLGRIRYGVNSKSKTHLGAASRDIMGVNDANSLSDEELRRMTKRYRDQAQYYEARNNYIQQERYFKQNTSPQQKEKRQSGIGRFMSNVFGQPFQSFMAKNVQFGLGALGYGILSPEHPELATQYLNSVTGFNMQYHKKDPVKDATDEITKNAKYWEALNSLEKNKRENENIKNGKYDTDLEKERLLKQYQFTNKFDAAKNKYESNRYNEEQQKMKEIGEGFRKIWDHNANEFIYESFTPGWDPDEENWGSYSNGGNTHPKKKSSDYWDPDQGQYNSNGGMRFPKKKDDSDNVWKFYPDDDNKKKK